MCMMKDKRWRSRKIISWTGKEGFVRGTKMHDKQSAHRALRARNAHTLGTMLIIVPYVHYTLNRCLKYCS